MREPGVVSGDFHSQLRIHSQLSESTVHRVGVIRLETGGLLDSTKPKREREQSYDSSCEWPLSEAISAQFQRVRGWPSQMMSKKVREVLWLQRLLTGRQILKRIRKYE